MTTRRNIPGFEGFYSADEQGLIWSEQRYVRHPSGGQAIKPLRQLRTHLNCKGRRYATFSIDGISTKHLVGRLVCMAFHGPPPMGTEACHNDGDCLNDKPDNLRWDTRTNNHADKVKHGTTLRGEQGSNVKLTSEQVALIRSDDRMQREIAQSYGISQAQVCRIRARKRWGHE